MNELESAYKNIEQAQKEFGVLWQREFPEGTRISWLWQSRYEQFGTVEHCGGGKYPFLRARNERTGRVVSVYYWDKPQRA